MKQPPINYTLTHEALNTHETDCLVVSVREEILSSEALELDKHLNGYIQNLIDSKEFSGKASSLFPIYHPTGIQAKRVLLMGLGNEETLSLNIMKNAVKTATKWIKNTPSQTATFALLGRCTNKSASIPAIIEAAGSATYLYEAFKSEKAPERTLHTLTLFIQEASAEATEALNHGAALVKGMELAKDLGNAPGNCIYPETLSEAAEDLAKEYKHLLSCKILNDADIMRLGMNALMAVAKGSIESPNLIVLHYDNAPDREEKPIVLVGKGVTFDSGGISLKPGAAMDEMKYDMCGAASVLGAFKAMAELELPINAIGIIPAVENMPSGSAVKPGDVVTSMSGQTIEVLNTDAEGRLILCDALTYAEQFDPEVVVDIATLTGAIIVALGHIPTGLFANDDALAERIKKAAEKTQDRVWQLPIWEDYQPLLDSNFADMGNIGGGRAGGSITAACFLARFAKKFPWAHLDIAGTAWDSGAKKGSTGRPVPLLVEFLKSYVVK